MLAFFLFLNLMTLVRLEKCNVPNNKYVKSSLERANDVKCKEKIKQISCMFEEQNRLSQNLNDLKGKKIIYELYSESKCPKLFSFNRSAEFFQGCIEKSPLERHLKAFTLEEKNEIEKKFKIQKFSIYKNINSLETCVNMCLTINQYSYCAYSQKLLECVCLKNLTFEFRSQINLPCTNIGDFFSVYRTGLIETKRDNFFYNKQSIQSIMSEFRKLKEEKNLPRIVFILTLNGRSLRQVFRLIKTIYDDIHFYYFHIDKRMTYLRTKIEKFLNEKRKKNFHISKWSFPTIWGGSNLLQMHLKVMEELIEMKDKNLWPWDFVLNLSESDFPVKSVQELTLFLNQNRNTNFLKFFKTHYEKFSMNQAYETAFLQCENRMWRLGDKTIPIGIQFSGGSDWFCLNSKFVDYIIKSKENFVDNLKHFFEYSLLPSESFFHTVLINSPFCEQNYVNFNLRFVNWQRKLGCNCQHKKVVDWCGCSPNFLSFKSSIQAIKDLNSVPIFFARKFDPLRNNLMINYVDQSIYGFYSADFKSLTSFWQNVFDSSEQNENKFQILFELMSKISWNKLENLINVAKLDTNFVGKEYFLRSVEAFFEADSFKGYVLNFKTNNNFEFEAFFRLNSFKNLIKIFKLNESKNQTLIIMRENFLQSLIKIQISTDFEQKERQFSNYANVMDVNSNPILAIELDPIQVPLEFSVKWINPLGSLVKEKYIKMNSSEKNQLLVHSLEQSENLTIKKSPGEWKLDICMHDVAHEFLVLSKKFLILPKMIEVFSIWSSIIENFWQFDSLCANQIELGLYLNHSFLVKHIFNDCKECSHWSSYYPDPKSDLNSNLDINFSYRIV